MGLFGSKKKTEEVKKDAAVAAPAKSTRSVARKAASKANAEKAPKVAKVAATPADAKGAMVNENNRVILRPRITEKASLLADTRNVYTFEISKDATKLQVRKAVASVYGVVPVKVSIARTPGKNIFYRGRMGSVSGIKKAYVYLNKGDKIELV